MNYYSHHIGDYAAHTSHLSLLEHGVYRRLLDIYYLNEAPFANDINAICRKVGARTDDEKLAIDAILSEFFVLTDLGFTQKRCDSELLAFVVKSTKASDSANSRWSKKTENDANAMRTHEISMRTHCERIANALPTHCESDANALRPLCDVDGERMANAMLTNNHKPITNNQNKEKSKTTPSAELSKPQDVEESVWQDFVAIRKAKKAPLTETALAGIASEAKKANMTLQAALTECCSRGWQGFKADWVVKDSPAKPNATSSMQPHPTMPGKFLFHGVMM